MVLATKHRLNRIAAVAAWVFVSLGANAPAATAVAKPRPVLSISGETLHWSPITGETSYSIKTVVEGKTKKVVVSADEAPAAVIPEKTIKYSVICVDSTKCAVSNTITVTWPKEKEKTAKSCFASPESCEFPGKLNTGPESKGTAACSSYPAAEELSLTTPGQIIEHKRLLAIKVKAANVTLKDDCLEFNGGGTHGEGNIQLEEGANNFLVTESVIQGKNSTNESEEVALTNKANVSGATATKDLITNCFNCVEYGWTINDSYINANVVPQPTGAHMEAWFYQGDTISANHDTILQAAASDGVFFGASTVGTKPPCLSNKATVTNSLLAGASYIFELCASTETGKTTVIENNRIARCVSCTGLPEGKDDGFGYYTKGGASDLALYEGGNVTFTGNVWDNNSEAIESKTQVSCFSSPKSCGFPDFTTSGVQNCSLLPMSGNIPLKAGETVSGKDIHGYIKVEGNNAKVINSCVTKGGGFGDESVFIEKGVTGFSIENSTIKGENTESHFVEEALTNDYSSGIAVAKNVLLYNCGECLHGEWTVTDSYVMANGGRNQSCGAGCVVHFEDIFFNGNGEGKVTFEHDTLLNPEKQTAVLFGESNPCSTHLILKNSLVAGGGYMMYPCAHASSKGSSTEIVEGNRFARCKTTAISDPAGGGGFVCQGGPDSFGYFPGGGWSSSGNATQTASFEPIGPNNVWDDNGEKVN